MTKDSSRRSSIAGSVHSPSLPENGEDHPVPEQQLPSAPSLNVAPSDPMDVDTNKPEDICIVSMRQPESQPMTASNSTSSNPSTNDNASGTAATYGTRSRRTTTITRPNYAEDKELDAEFELAPIKEPKMRKSAKGAVDVAPTTTNMDFGGSAKPLQAEALEEDLIVSMPSHYKDPIPGTSTFSAKPTTKKRKATTQIPPPETFRPYQVPPLNYLAPQPTARKSGHAAELVPGIRESNMLSFDSCQGRLKGKKLVADDGTVLEINDHVYMICEPPGEPYYMGRVMEFIHANSDPSKGVEALRLNWYYRPKDIGRNVNDTRQVFASMHSDISPLTALRGKCQIKHRSEFEKLDDIRRKNDCFWYEKLYDRYIHRYYDVIPSRTVINVPANVKKVLDDRWKFIVVEPSRGKELTSAKKSCKKCNKYCANNDSVDCAVCKSTYHMSCVSPPLQKKPSRGFAWACGPCSKAQERKLEARLTPNVNDILDEEDEFNDEEDSPMSLEDAPEHDSNEVQTPVVLTTHSDIQQPSSWLFRYLGVHCKVEDVLDSDDRIYPRASSRLGPKHQAIVTAWHGKPVEYVEPIEIKRRMQKGPAGKKVLLPTKESLQAIEWDRIDKESRPKWVMDKPPGFVHRGEDMDSDDPNNTAKLIFKLPESLETTTRLERGGNDTEHTDQLGITDRERLVNEYMHRAKQLAIPLGLPERSTNLLDMALDMLRAHSYDTEKALHALTLVDKQAFKEPELSAIELKKFEDGVAKFGSEWHSIKKHVKTVSAANIVRFYYTWKKTERGKQVWGKYSGRKGKKEAKRNDTSTGKLQDDVADEYDDSAFDNNKAFQKKRRFQCKFCSTQHSRQWRRAPNTPAGSIIAENPAGKTGKEKGEKFMVALCRRCAELWRRYGIQWEDIDEAAKKLVPGNGRAWKRKIDEEVLKELLVANDTLYALNGPPILPISANGTPVPMPPGLQPGVEPPKKKAKGAMGAQPDLGEQPMDFGNISNPPPPQKKKAEKPPPPPPPPPEPPKARILPCAICNELDPMGDQLLACSWCRMSVHRACYGVIGETRSLNKWACDTCSNDKNPQVSHKYECVLCPVKFTEQDFIEPPKAAHKKKNDKDRERDRLEREKAEKDADFFRQRQIDLNRPLNPREPLKRTANNNWVHVTCAIFTPEVKFSNAKALEHSEGIPSIQPSKYDETCKACKQKGGACVSCRSCHASVHVECAHHAGYIIGFDVTPVKGSRRDHANVVTINGDTGTMAAAIWCKDHGPTKSTVHQLQATVEGADLTALQLFVQNYKQADLTLTGTVRKAMLINQSSKVLNPIPVASVSNRRTSTTNATAGRGSVSHIKAEEVSKETNAVKCAEPDPICITCEADVSPKWYPYIPVVVESVIPTESLSLTNGESRADDSPMVNGCTTEDAAEITASQVAIATAALHENTRPCSPGSPPLLTEKQCHKCYVRNIKIKEPSPPPKSPSREPTPPPVETSVDVPMPDANMVPPVPQYAWTQPSYAPSGPYVNVPTPSPTIHGPPLNHINGIPSPHINNNSTQHFSGQPQMRQQGPSHSPHQNGHATHGSNGYSAPPPHIESSSSGGHMPNGSSYSSYSSTRPQPHHLTNGGPPPHAPERPVQQPLHTDFHYSPTYAPHSGHMNGNGNHARDPHMEPRDGRRDGSQRPVNGSPRQLEHSFQHQTPPESSRYSPPIPLDPALLATGPAPQPEPYRHVNNGQNIGNVNGNQNQDRRIDGGASASPSLRNLLS